MDFNAMRQESERHNKDNNQNEFLDKFVKLPKDEGKLVIRILPPSHGMTLPFQPTRLHILGKKPKARSYHCRRELEGGKWVGKTGLCPACDVYSHLWDEANRSTGDTAKDYIAKARSIKPIERFYYNAVVRDDPSQLGTKIFSCGKILHKIILRGFVGDEYKKGLGDISDVTGKEGRDLMIVKRIQGADGFPNYAESAFLDPSPLGTKEEIEKFLEECHELSPLRSVKEIEVIDRALQIHFGAIPQEEGTVDPTKYNLGGDVTIVSPMETVTEPETVVTVQETPVDSTPVEEPVKESVPVVEDDDVMVDSEFMKELEDL
jgi:hypothetical protein